MGKPWQCPLADTVDRSVSICPDICYLPLAGVVVQVALFSIPCYGIGCPLQALMGHHMLYVDQGLQSTTLSFTRRRTSSHRWAHADPGPAGPPHPRGSWIQCPPRRQAEGPGPGDTGPARTPTPRAHGPGTHCAGRPKDLDQMTWVLLEP